MKFKNIIIWESFNILISNRQFFSIIFDCISKKVKVNFQLPPQKTHTHSAAYKFWESTIYFVYMLHFLSLGESAKICSNRAVVIKVKDTVFFFGFF